MSNGREQAMATASEIKERMEVLGSDGEHVGTVDRVEEDEMIRLANDDAPDGKYHYIPVDFVDRVDEQVHLSLTAEEAVEEWEDEDEDEEVEPLSFGDGIDAEEDDDEGEDSDEWVDERPR
jgi:hypothetical protein